MIELVNLSAGYGGRLVLDELSLTLPKGRLISLVGANGCGKSTLLKTIVGIVQSDTGKIVIDGTDAAELPRREQAKKIAYLPQGKNVPDMTVGQMVLHGRFPHLCYPRRYSEKDRQLAHAALRQMGLETLSDKPLTALSGGLRQNAYIAMALTQDADYILLDEPTTYLDIANQVELMRILRTLAESGKGVVTVMHDLPLAFGFSDSVAVMRNGKIAVCDTPQNVCACGIVTDIFGIKLQYAADENVYHYRYTLR